MNAVEAEQRIRVVAEDLAETYYEIGGLHKEIARIENRLVSVRNLRDAYENEFMSLQQEFPTLQDKTLKDFL